MHERGGVPQLDIYPYVCSVDSLCMLPNSPLVMLDIKLVYK